MGYGKVAPAPLIRIFPAAMATPATASRPTRIFFIERSLWGFFRLGCTSETWRTCDEPAISSCRDRQPDPETAAASAAFDPDLTALRLDEVLHDREAQASAARLPGASHVHPVEALEDALSVPGLDPGSRVDHRKHGERPSAVGQQRDAAALRSELHRVVQ